MSSITLTLTGNDSVLTTNFFPEIVLDPQYNYSCGLLDFHTWNSIPNIHEGNNKFYYQRLEDTKYKKITIPTGCYEIADLHIYLRTQLRKEGVDFSLQINKNTLKCEIACTANMNFEKPDCLRSVLGFEHAELAGGMHIHVSDHPVNISNVNAIRIECNITTGSYHNGQPSHTIYEFGLDVNAGYKIYHRPNNVVYLPIVSNRINTLQISLVDQNNNLLNLRGEAVTCRLHIKRET